MPRQRRVLPSWAESVGLPSWAESVNLHSWAEHVGPTFLGGAQSYRGSELCCGSELCSRIIPRQSLVLQKTVPRQSLVLQESIPKQRLGLPFRSVGVTQKKAPERLFSLLLGRCYSRAPSYTVCRRSPVKSLTPYANRRMPFTLPAALRVTTATPPCG